MIIRLTPELKVSPDVAIKTGELVHECDTKLFRQSLKMSQTNEDTPVV